MELKDIADLFIAATGKVEFYWNFYTVTLLALIGWFASIKKGIALRLKLLITVGYLLFVFMNLIGLLSSYTFAEALRLDLLSASKTMPGTLENARAVLSQRSLESQKTFAIFIHAILAISVLYVVWFGRLGEQRTNRGE